MTKEVEGLTAVENAMLKRIGRGVKKDSTITPAEVRTLRRLVAKGFAVEDEKENKDGSVSIKWVKA